MGTLAYGFCFGTVDEARAYHYTSVPAALTAGSTTFEAYFTPTQTCKSQISSTGVRGSNYCVASIPLDFQSCDQAALVSEGIAMGWLVVAPLLLIWGYSKIRAQLR